jgi:predicted transcriptional regulator
MYVPTQVIDAVKETKANTSEAKPRLKARKPKVIKNKTITKRILNAMARGLRTATAIANDLDADKNAVQNTLWNMKSRGAVLGTKRDGKEQKYFLLSEKSSVGVTAKKARKPYTKRKAKVETPHPILVETKEDKAFDAEMNRLVQRLNALEHTLIEKEKEVWTLECEVFDKKAIIKYLEEKLFKLGVSV